VARTLEAVLGPDLPVAVRAYDGSRLGEADAPTLAIRSPNVFRRLVTSPGELGLGIALAAASMTRMNRPRPASAGFG